MATPVPALPSAQGPIADPQSGRIDPTWYRQVSTLVEVIREQAKQIETLRQALNEARQNPTTTFPPVAPF